MKNDSMGEIGSIAKSRNTETFDGRFGIVSYRQTTARNFRSKLKQAKRDMVAKDPDSGAWRVDDTHTLKQYQNDSLYITKGGSTFAITDSGDIVSVAKHPNDKGTSGSDLIKMAVQKGGKKLDSFDGNFNFYVRNGFTPVSWTKWDDEYAPTDWRMGKDRRENVIFFKYTGRGYDADMNTFYSRVKPSKDYDSAQAKRDRKVKK